VTAIGPDDGTLETASSGLVLDADGARAVAERTLLEPPRRATC
jgi:hypothetical protein